MEDTATAAPALDRAPRSSVLTPSLAASVIDAMGELIDDVVEADRAIARAIANRAALIDQARSWSEATASLMPPDAFAVRGWSAAHVARRSLVSELAAALHLPERTTENLIEESRSLLRELPATMTALADGEISHRHARVMIDHANSLPLDARRSFEEAALPFAVTLTPCRFDHRARVLREREHPESIEVRQNSCRDKRELSLDPARDGMAWLTAYLPAASAQSVYDRVTDIAAALQRPDEPRTLSQLRADVFCDLLIDGQTDASHPTQPNLGRGIRARVLVTVPVLTLLGRGSEPAMLEGYGPIDIDTARELAAGAPGFVRILTHPETGAVLSLGRDRYAIPPRPSRLAPHAGRNLPCPGMRCRRPALRSRPYEGLAVRRSVEPRQSRASLPEAPRPEAPHRVDRRPYRRWRPRVDLAHRAPLRDRAGNPHDGGTLTAQRSAAQRSAAPRQRRAATATRKSWRGRRPGIMFAPASGSRKHDRRRGRQSWRRPPRDRRDRDDQHAAEEQNEWGNGRGGDALHDCRCRPNHSSPRWRRVDTRGGRHAGLN
jgi:hypothetical protein